ncbi:uncharacterized protein Tco025E_01460 [Trypanosoma conorhini]|uniref:Uncharacterized protein n=1 Tax=Trypanosoma conorhini TaxID=83891 RepID=A0A422Q8G4_9TRYP|nr:uncharacterized protein Tco025E_01460 [Trypanosoma conorhini]RNF26244.1 hypothetical protein Tco025E_01460 [Trypanosoma conorhini]
MRASAMLGALDHTATDALQSFHDALQRAQQALQQEELRLAQLTQTVRQQQESNGARRDAIRSQQQQRLEALRREIMRVRSHVERQKEEAEAQQQHVEAVRRPRQETEAESRAQKKSLEQLQRQYLANSVAVHAELLQWWQPQNSLTSLEAQAARKAEEVAALQGAVQALQQQLHEYTGEQHAPRTETSLQGHVQGARDEAAAVAPGTACGDDAVSSSACLEQQLLQQREAREAFTRHSTDALTLRRGEVERLKTRLKQLCADVEAADAAQQVAQQEFHSALNQQSEARLRCGGCGKEIVDSFVS